MMLSTISRSTQNLLRNLAIAFAALLGGSPQAAHALAVNGFYAEDARCDTHPSQSLPHEIGETTAFPIDERISVVVSPALSFACVADDGFPNDFVVQMTNLSQIRRNLGRRRGPEPRAAGFEAGAAWTQKSM